LSRNYIALTTLKKNLGGDVGRVEDPPKGASHEPFIEYLFHEFSVRFSSGRMVISCLKLVSPANSVNILEQRVSVKHYTLQWQKKVEIIECLV
jgi:hypothetical protein